MLPTRRLMLSYGALKLFPVWDPLRGDPRFDKIVASFSAEAIAVALTTAFGLEG